MGNLLCKQGSVETDDIPEDQNSHVTVRLPNLFVLFLSEAPVVNPNYRKLKGKSEKWISKTCAFDKRMQRITTKTDFAYFISISAPEAGPERLRTFFDWGNWVFPFDDMFDNGIFRDDQKGGHGMIDRLLLRFKEGNELDPHVDGNPLIEVVHSVWIRVFKNSPKGVSRRFAEAMVDYAHGTISQVEISSLGQHPSLEEVLDLRRESAGVSPLFPLVEYAHQLNLPEEVFECRSIREIIRIGVDFVVIQNDILSYCKEEREGVPHNLVAVCRDSGMAAQEAFDHIGQMLDARYRDWYLALAELPSWGPEIDSQVQNYIRGVQNVVKANLHWSFRSGRYFGDALDEVRSTMKVRVQRRDVDKKNLGPRSRGQSRASGTLLEPQPPYKWAIDSVDM